MVPEENFAHQVRDALTNFYDPVCLQTHPLADLLALPQVVREARSQSLRQLLRESIDALKPAATVPLDRPEWLGYRVLWLRYVQSLSPSEVGQELGLSRATFFRHHQRALEAVVSLLWERSRQTARENVTNMALAERARQEAVKVAHASTDRSVPAWEVLQGVLRTTRPLAAQQGVELLADVPDEQVALYGDTTLVRQVILNVVVEGLKHASSRTMRLTSQVGERQVVWRLSGFDVPVRDLRLWEQWPGISISQGLLQVCGGLVQLKVDADGNPELELMLPLAPIRTILLIDDDADSLNLLRRYLQGHYRLAVAQRGDELADLLAKTKPDLILLDVLMPREDGWEILQRLKTSPQTASVPVVICSVLAQPALALSLGAAGVLQKPLDQETLLRTIQGLL